MSTKSPIDTEAVIARVLADPWTHEHNTDGGAAAADFIRNAKARNQRSQADKDASRAANVARVLAAMERHGS
jgi:hypothetical protein